MFWDIKSLSACLVKFFYNESVLFSLQTIFVAGKLLTFVINFLSAVLDFLFTLLIDLNHKLIHNKLK